MKKLWTILGFVAITALTFSCSSSGSGDGDTDPTTPTTPTNPGTNEVDFWLTTSSESAKLAKQNTVLAFGTTANSNPDILVDPTQTFQTVDGFGYTLTGGSAAVISNLNATRRQELLQELFNPETGIGISYLRISIGASDMNESAYTYDDLPSGQTDASLSNFSISNDTQLTTLIQSILAINPNIKILATPWSAPVWMKTNNSFVGGSLKPEYYSTYAQYFVKYIQAMQSLGININAITPQNEPLNPYNNPSMVMEAVSQADFIKNNLGPAFQTAGLNTKIIAYDHNCDVYQYPITVLNDAGARPFVDGSAFHLYAGDISALSIVHNAYPDKNVYFTEQYTSSTGSFGGDLKWHIKNVIIGSMRNWSRNALEWNLATDGNYGPHTDGGCTVCKAAVTVIGTDNYQRNVSYYIIAHASKFVPAGSVRVGSNIAGNLSTVAFKRPDGKMVLIAENDGTAVQSFNIKYNNRWVTTILDAGAVGTYVW